MQDYKVATLNINRLESARKVQALKDYIYAADIDILMLQEVCTTDFSNIYSYDVNFNIAQESGTAILVRHGIHYEMTALLENGRGISFQIQDILLINKKMFKCLLSLRDLTTGSSVPKLTNYL